MTVKQAIEELQKLSPEALVFIDVENIAGECVVTEKFCFQAQKSDETNEVFITNIP